MRDRDADERLRDDDATVPQASQLKCIDTFTNVHVRHVQGTAMGLAMRQGANPGFTLFLLVDLYKSFSIYYSTFFFILLFFGSGLHP